MRKKVFILALCILFILSGCKGSSDETREVSFSFFGGKPEAETLLLTETVLGSVEGLICPTEKYTNIVHRMVEGDQSASIYQFVPGETSGKAHTVLEFQGVSCNNDTENGFECINIEWFGDCAIGEKACKTEGVIVLSDSEDKRRLYIMEPVGAATEEIRECKENTWKSIVGHNLKGTDALYERTEEEDGLRVLYSAENKEWSGYVTFWYDYATERIYEAIYIEYKESYNSDRALELIRSVSYVDSQLEQKVFELTAEFGEPFSLYAGDIFEGNILSLSRMSARAEKEFTVGENSLYFLNEGKEYQITLNMVDTTPPVITYKGGENAVQYFMLDEELDAKELAAAIFEASDASGTVEVSFADGRKQVVITEGEFGSESLTEVGLKVKDSSGNTRETVVYPAVLERDRIPEWYYVFFEERVDKKSVSRLRSVLTDTSYQPEEYLQAWYKAGGIRLSISNESMEQALQGYRRAEESGLKVAVSDTVQPGEDVLFYAQLNLVPEELLHRYIECGEVYELDALEAREYQFARITQDLIDATVKGMEKAEEIGISFSVDGTLDILTLMKVCGMICDEEDAIKFAMTCGDNVTDMGTLEFLGLLVENSGALDMCLKLKNLGTDVYIDDRSGEFVIRCLSQMERIPEEFLKMCAEEDIKLCILWEDILRYAVPESVYWEGISWEETMNWAEVVKNSKVSVDYSKGVSLQALIEFYQMMPKLPEWCLDLYGKNDWELSMSMVEQRIYADALNYMDEEIYEKAWNGYNKLQKHKVKVEYLDVWQPVEL